MTNTNTKPKVIHVSGRRWFQKTYGNTYHSFKIWIDEEHVQTQTGCYGYDRMYLQNAQEWLDKNGHLPGLKHHNNGSSEPLWAYCDRTGIKLVDEVTDVSREKDL